MSLLSIFGLLCTFATIFFKVYADNVPINPSKLQTNMAKMRQATTRSAFIQILRFIKFIRSKKERWKSGFLLRFSAQVWEEKNCQQRKCAICYRNSRKLKTRKSCTDIVRKVKQTLTVLISTIFIINNKRLFWYYLRRRSLC
jgi:hypothetical protein